MLKNTTDSYGVVTRLLHWIVGLTIITMLCVGFYMSSLEPSDQKWQIYGLHKATGVIVLALVIIRFSWRLVNIIPSLPKTVPGLQAIGYRFGMKLMYLLMFLMPSSGILMSLYSAKAIPVYGIFTINAFEANKELATIFHTIHVYSGIALACIATFHAAVGIYHHFIVKDRLLLRMIVGK
jgi:cytochrome b561